MLTFFRRIRKGLLGNGTTGKYLLYAVGEIALVVIGILVALQINNWNEYSKEREMETEILENLLSNLNRNLNNLTNAIESNESRLNSANVVLNHIDHDFPYNDTLDHHFFFGALRGDPLSGYPSKDGYEMFKNSGFDKVINDTLKLNIVYLFEEIYKGVEDWGTYIAGFAPTDYTLWLKYFNRYRQSLKPLDYAKLLSSTEVRSYYVQTTTFNSIYLERLRQSLDETQRVLQLIKDELNDSGD